MSKVDDVLQKRANLVSYLTGTGIEIGALHNPLYAPNVTVKYVDRMTRSKLLEQYPELKGCPIVEPDIISDAESLTNVDDRSQDFVIANHVIEHMRNPISSLLHWQRVLRVGGKLFLAVPDKRFTFDKERQMTPISHIFDDYTNPDQERDRAAFADYALHVSCRIFNARPEAEYLEYARYLEEIDYSIHFHVWDESSFKLLLKHIHEHVPEWQFQIIDSYSTEADEFAFVFEKTV